MKTRVLATGLVAVLVMLVSVGVWQGLQSESWLAYQLASWVGRAPYGARAEHHRTLPDVVRHSHGRATVVADTYGEGYEQVLRNVLHGIGLMDHDGHAIRHLDQFNLPPTFSLAEPFAALMAPYDIDGDGRSEVVAVAPRHDLSEWRLWVIDVDGQVVKGEAVLPHGPDVRRPDGIWDGLYYPVAALPVPGLAHPAVLLACVVHFDVDGRGVLAVDPVAGEVLWHFEMGCLPSVSGIELADLDGDGRLEIVLAGGAPNNLKGELINHTSDDSTRVFVLSAEGKLRWQRALGGPNDGAAVAVVDLDDDGNLGVVTAVADPHGLGGRLSVWSAHGDLLYDEPGRARRPRWMRAVASGVQELPAVVVLNSDQWLESYRWDGRRLDLVASRRMTAGARLTGVVEAIPEQAGQQLVLADLDRVLLLDAGLRTQAIVPTELAQLRVPPIVWQARPDLQYLLLPGATAYLHTLQRQPLIPGWLMAAAAGAALLVTAAVSQGVAVLRMWRRQSPRDAGVESDPAVLRALRREMLGLLEKGGHEKIGVLKSLRRLIWHLEAAVSVTLPGAGATAKTEIVGAARQRALAAAATFRRETLPLLREVLSLARRTAVAPHVAATVADILDEVEAILNDLELGRDDMAAVLSTAKRLNREVEAQLQRLRRAVEETFCCSLPQAVVRVLDAQAETLRGGGVLVEIVGGDSGDGAPWVRVDPPDIEFILDNLVGNAIRAMADAPRRVLRVGWTVEWSRVECTVADSGCGIAPDDWERIFELGASDRQSGGLGLARSRRELSIYGGSLKVAASQPGRGTTFALVLPAARVAVGDDEAARPLRLLEREEEA